MTSLGLTNIFIYDNIEHVFNDNKNLSS